MIDQDRAAHRAHTVPGCSGCEAFREEAAGLDVEVVAYQLWDAIGGNIIDQYEADLYSVVGVDANGVPHRLVARVAK